MVFGDTDMGGRNGGGDGGTGPPQTFSVFNIMPMGGAWKELTFFLNTPPPMNR